MVTHIRNYFDENRLFYGIAIVLILVNLIVSAAYINPLREKIDGIKSEYFSLRKEKIKISDELRNSEERALKIEALRKDIETFVGELPAEREMTRIIQKIHALAGKAKLNIRTARYSMSKMAKEGLVNYSISFPLTGKYRQIRKFIYNLEKMPYLMSIDDLSISSNRFNTVSLSLKVSLYFKMADR